MRTLFALSLASMAVALTAANAPHLNLPRNPEPEELSRLDECIQKRFLGRTSFGMNRILPQQVHGVRTFQPENPTELAVVSELQRKGYEVALYLAGRNILAAPVPGDPPIFDRRRLGVQGPAFITRLRNTAELPGPDALLADSRQALASFQDGAGYDIRKGEWTVAMRPLRASNATCLQCHNATHAGSGLKIGDTLGVVLYVYR